MKQTTLTADREEILRALAVILEPGQVTELRALNVSTPAYRKPHVESGYFNDPDALAAAAAAIPTASGIYFIPNLVNPDLLARSANRVKPVSHNESTSDDYIVGRRWLLVDFDAKRPAGISSSDAEHEAALGRAKEVGKALPAEGWPKPLLADSGNGAHLLYRIDLPNDDASRDLVERCLKALDFRFSDEVIQGDVTNFNASRIWKLYGTSVRKGDALPERPHRLARLLYVPDPLEIVSVELLNRLAAGLPEPEPEPAREKSATRFSTGEPFDLEQWIKDHQLQVGEPVKWHNTGKKWIFSTCPWNSEHTNRSAFIVQWPNGTIGAGCHHNSCAGKDWHALRDEVEPGWRDRRPARAEKSDHKKKTTGDRATGTPPAEPDRPEIDAGDRNLPRITAAVWDAIERSNDPPYLFRYGGRPAWLEYGDHQEPAIALLDKAGFRHVAARAATWYRRKQVQEEWLRLDAVPPLDVVEDCLVLREKPLPILAGLIEAPTFASNGTLSTMPGYHPESRLFYAPHPTLKVPTIPPNPTREEVDRAKELLLTGFLGDFPFVGEGEKAHALALLLLPFVRELIDGPTPLHLIEKPAPGTGAGLLADMLLFPATGRPLPVLTEGWNEDEWRKRITALLRAGAGAILIDNVRHRLDSATVSAAITSRLWEDRLLGTSETVRVPVRCAWIATGNNPALSSEITRRTVRIRLDAKTDRPWLRTGFRHPNLRQWATDHRGDLVAAALILCQAFVAAGRPQTTSDRPFGMFESWSEVLGGILDFVEVPGFLGNLESFYEDSDTEGAAWRTFLAAWWEKFGDREVGVSDLYQLALDSDSPFDLGEGSERSQRTRLGKQLGANRDRQFDDLRIVAGKTEKRLQQWKLVYVGVRGVRFAPRARKNEVVENSNLGEEENVHQRTPRTPRTPEEEEEEVVVI